MTHEEAGQLILENDPFRHCRECEGEGRLLIEIRTDMETGTLAREVETYQHCRPCEGTGKVLTDDYRVACKLLARPLPVPPKKIRKMPPTAQRLIDIPVKSPPMKLNFGNLYKKP